MRINRKINIPGTYSNLDGSVMFVGSEEDKKRYKKDEKEVFNHWKNLLLDIMYGRMDCLSIEYPHTVCTLSPGIEDVNKVRYSNFFKKENGKLDAILHHEFSEDELDILIRTYLFPISKDKTNREVEIVLQSEWKEQGVEVEDGEWCWDMYVGDGEYWSITSTKDGYIIEADGRWVHHEAKTLEFAKDWAEKEIEEMYFADVLQDENDEYQLYLRADCVRELRDLDGNVLLETDSEECWTVEDALEELRENEQDLEL